MPARSVHPAAVAIGVVVVVAGGIWVAGLLSPSVYVHGVVAAAWVAVVGLGIWRVVPRERGPRVAAWSALVTTAVVVLVVGAVMSRPNEANEQVVTADQSPATAPAGEASGGQADDSGGNTLVASGQFESLAHEGKGKASVIELADGSRKLTLTDFKTDSGPDLFVYVVAGDPKSDGDVDEFLNLGKLKGNSGDQQYDLPKKFEASKYPHVYIWCRAFTVGFTRARLIT